MSLLLDALQRASKDKEKAALAAGLTPRPEEFAPSTSSSPASTPSPELSLEPAAELTLTEKDAAEVPLPVLVREYLAPPVAPSPAVAQVSAPARVPEPTQSMQRELPQALSLDFAPEPPTPVPPPLPPSVARSAATSSLAPALSLDPGPVPSPTPASSSPGRTAQDIRRAYTPAHVVGNGRRRTLVFVGIAIALAVVVAGLYLKSLQSVVPPLAPPLAAVPNAAPEADSALTPTPVASDATVAGAAPANTSAPVPSDIEPLAAAEPRSAPTAPAAVPNKPATEMPRPVEQAVPTKRTPPATPAVAQATATGNDVLLQGTGAAEKSAFVAKTRGPSPLEVGYAALVLGRMDEATQAYQQALTANPQERDALLGLAYIAQKKGQSDDAQALYRRVLRQEPGNAIANAALLALEAESGSAQTASRARELALRQPDSAATMSMAGNAAVREGLIADAALLFARAQFLEPGNPLHAYNHAVALDRLGQYSAAAVQYEKVLKLSEGTAPVAGRAYSVDTVKERLAQLRQALSNRTEATK